jgi:hypothetical protein
MIFKFATFIEENMKVTIFRHWVVLGGGHINIAGFQKMSIILSDL